MSSRTPRRLRYAAITLADVVVAGPSSSNRGQSRNLPTRSRFSEGTSKRRPFFAAKRPNMPLST